MQLKDHSDREWSAFQQPLLPEADRIERPQDLYRLGRSVSLPFGGFAEQHILNLRIGPLDDVAEDRFASPQRGNQKARFDLSRLTDQFSDGGARIAIAQQQRPR